MQPCDRVLYVTRYIRPHAGLYIYVYIEVTRELLGV